MTIRKWGTTKTDGKFYRPNLKSSTATYIKCPITHSLTFL